MPKKGALFHKLYYKRYRKEKPKHNANGNNVGKEKNTSEDKEVVAVEEQLQKLSLEEELVYLAYFKTCLVARDKDILKIKMKQSISLREKVIRRREIKFVESFPFYFVSPDLVMVFQFFVLIVIEKRYFFMISDFI